jgi:hypothetical protein
MSNEKKSFNETGKEVSMIRKGMINYLKENNKEEQVKKFYRMKYFDGDTYFNIKYDSLVIEATSRLEAIIILKDYFNSNVKTIDPFDSFEDESFIDILSDYDIYDIDDQNYDKIFKSQHVHSLFFDYIELQFENDSLWLVECEALEVLKASF